MSSRRPALHRRSVAAAAWTGRAPRWEDHRVRVARHARLWQQRRLRYLASPESPWDGDRTTDED
ncbi:hypothetical protein [Streptomyces sp. NPDC055681]